jgi:hypothetical protein
VVKSSVLTDRPDATPDEKLATADKSFVMLDWLYKAELQLYPNPPDVAHCPEFAAEK